MCVGFVPQHFREARFPLGGRASLLRSGRIACLVVTLLSACGPSTPVVEEKISGAWTPSSWTLQSAEGSRDGEKTRAWIVFKDPSGRKLELRLQIATTPDAELEVGRWYLDDAGVSRSGPASAKGIKFLGGQGGRPSVGGTYFFEEGDEEVFRVKLPAVELAPRSK